MIRASKKQMLHALDLMKIPGKTIADVAKEVNFPADMVRDWKDRYFNTGKQPYDPKSPDALRRAARPEHMKMMTEKKKELKQQAQGIAPLAISVHDHAMAKLEAENKRLRNIIKLFINAGDDLI